MSRVFIFRLSALALLVVLVAILAPSASAAEPAPTGSFTRTFYNYIDEGGASCPAAGAIAGGTETDIFHFWREGTSPAAGVNVSNYMACWDGTLNFPQGGNWTVHTINDDGMDVYVDGKITMHGWYDQGPSLHDGTIHLSAGSHHVIVKYYNRGLGGVACVAWGPANNPTPFCQCPYSPGQPPAPPPPNPYPPPKPCYYCNPPPPPCPWCYTPLPEVYYCYYRVAWGDTLYSIAWRYGTTWYALAQANNIWNPNYIYAGMVLRIPYCN